MQAMLGFFAIISMISCSTGTHYLNANVQSTNYLNPNIYNQSAPLMISVYQLKSSMTFQQASFYEINNNADELLGADLLDKREIEIRPEQKQLLRIQLHPQTNYIGIVAGFRNTDIANWRQIVPIKSGKNIKINVIASTQAITIK